MANLTTSAIIVLVIVACLALVSLGAALSRQFFPADRETQYQTSRDQFLYMRTVRKRTLDHFHRASVHARDLESQYTSREASNYIESDMTPGFSTSHLSTPGT